MDPEVIVVGAGPVGLFLACELRLAGVRVTVLEQRAEPGPHTKGMAVHARTVEQLAMRGLAEPLLTAGVRLPSWHFGFLQTRVDFTTLDSPFPFVLSFPQNRAEAILEEKATELGASVIRGERVTAVSQDTSGVRVETATGEHRAAYVVGADGASSAVRQSAGIEFPGIEARFYSYLGDVRADSPPPPGFNVLNAHGSMMVAPMPGGVYRIAGYDPARQSDDGREITLDELRDICVRIAGRDFGIHDPQWLSRFGNTTRVAECYRQGRVLLAGDAAHMHFPAGGVGLNLGLQDAINLGWKLAAVVQGRAAEELLETYDTERRPWGDDVARHTMAQTALITATTPEGLALRALLSDLVADFPDVSGKLARRLSAIDVAYPPADPAAHPLTGARVAEADLPDARPLLLSPRPLPTASVTATRLGIRVATGPVTMIVRPDGYIWWATDDDDPDGPASAALEALGVSF
ncbi:FAD-dependent oxidoreductase [Actinoplanes sp. NPDC026619]|uniref:FAD-dependent oxidoreductase n=1 Tax=Actinoplanes sp. NPDC026619 TaxID=3155798 RepID=UPI0033DCA1F3